MLISSWHGNLNMKNNCNKLILNSCLFINNFEMQCTIFIRKDINVIKCLNNFREF